MSVGESVDLAELASEPVKVTALEPYELYEEEVSGTSSVKNITSLSLKVFLKTILTRMILEKPVFGLLSTTFRHPFIIGLSTLSKPIKEVATTDEQYVAVSNYNIAVMKNQCKDIQKMKQK